MTAGEEIGFRGHLLIRLLPIGSKRAVAVTGIVWAAWPLPFNVLFDTNGGLSGFPVFLVFAVLLGAFLGWVRLRSGSVWPPALAHSAVNSVSLIGSSVLWP